MLRRYPFPQGFLWGAATAAFQIEGAGAEDGKGESCWDRFCKVPGAIRDASDGMVACDHYHRLEEDLELMRALGLRSYRFSVSWPRVQPEGSGPVNAKGLDFYKRLVDGLLERGIEPNCTLNHWDHPQALEDKGGWRSRDMVGRFEDYSAILGRALGDRVFLWATHNEPSVIAGLGHELGIHAPGRKDSPQVVQQVVHHLLLAHGAAVRALRATVKRKDAQLGIVLSPAPIFPAQEDEAHWKAAERAWNWENDWWVLPLVEGRYPEDVLAARQAEGSAPRIEAGDLELIRQPIDYLGVNMYFPRMTEPDLGPKGWRFRPFDTRNEPLTSIGWEVFAPALRCLLHNFARRYKKPLYVTENGMSNASDAPDQEGRVRDTVRIRYLEQHLAMVSQAIEEGVDVRGYFHWSLMDNFEWSWGYTQRFGLIHIDYQTLQRTPKDSFAWYRDLIQANGFEGPQGRPERSRFERG
jgi:beta-glucosidase